MDQPEKAIVKSGQAYPPPWARARVSSQQRVVAMATTSDLDRQIEMLRRCEYIKESEVKALCSKAREILVEESNVQRVDAPVTVGAHSARGYRGVCGCQGSHRARPRGWLRHAPARSVATSTASSTT